MGGTAPRSLCLGGELLIPLRDAALRSPTVNQKSTRRKHTLPQLIPWQGHDRLARNSSPPLTATYYWWSGLHWTAKVDHSQSATNMAYTRASATVLTSSPMRFRSSGESPFSHSR